MLKNWSFWFYQVKAQLRLPGQCGHQITAYSVGFGTRRCCLVLCHLVQQHAHGSIHTIFNASILLWYPLTRPAWSCKPIHTAVVNYVVNIFHFSPSGLNSLWVCFIHVHCTSALKFALFSSHCYSFLKGEAGTVYQYMCTYLCLEVS